MFGKPEYAPVNTRINQRLADVGLAIVAHRGCVGGILAPNTPLAVRAALRGGADLISIDVSSSADATYYCFHDGYEAELLGVDDNIQAMTAAAIDKLSYIWADQPARLQRIARLLPLVKHFADETLFVLDRSWWRWPHLLGALDALGLPDRIVLKCPAREDAALDQLRRFEVKYPFVPICDNPTEAALVIGEPDINTVGVELITTSQDHPWFSRAQLDDLHGQGVFCMANTLALTTGVPLFGGLDDLHAITVGPEATYGPLVDLGVDAIHTDLPWLVRDFREARRG